MNEIEKIIDDLIYSKSNGIFMFAVNISHTSIEHNYTDSTAHTIDDLDSLTAMYINCLDYFEIKNIKDIEIKFMQEKIWCKLYFTANTKYGLNKFFLWFMGTTLEHYRQLSSKKY